MLITGRVGHQPELAIDDAMRALSTLDWSDPGSGLVTYHPVMRGNPYQALLYSRLDEAGLRAVPAYDLPNTIAITEAVAGSGLPVIVHAHWLNVVTSTATDEAEARTLVRTYVDQLHRLRELGARVMWTVHNILPHQTRWPELDVELRRGVVEAAERIHVMSPRTKDLVAPWFDLPDEKLITVPHPSYRDVYPSWMSREQARRELGIGSDQFVFLLIGRVQPYKGITELLDAFDALCLDEPGRNTLLVAGPAGTDEETTAFVERLRTHPSALGALGSIPDAEMQLYLRAADVAVFPYRRSLNSGAVALALTFGLPVLLPDDIGEASRGPESPYALHYSRTSPDGLTQALAAASKLATPEAHAAAVTAADQLSPARIGAEFATKIRQWLDQPRV